MTDLISTRSPESSLPHQQQQQRPLSINPGVPSLKYLQHINHSIRTESDLLSPIHSSFASSPSSPSPSTPCSTTGPAIGGRVSAAINSLYQASVPASASASDSSSPSLSVPRSNNSNNLARLSQQQSSSPLSRLHLPPVITSTQIQGNSRADQQGFLEDTLSSLSSLMNNPPQPQQHQQHQLLQGQQQQQKQTALIETARSIPSQTMALAITAPLYSSLPSPSSSLTTSTTTPTTPSPPPSTTLISPVPVPSSLSPSSSPTSFMSFAPENKKKSFAAPVMERKEGTQKQHNNNTQEEGAEKGSGQFKGENERRGSSTTTAMSTTTTTTTITSSSCDSPSTTLAANAAAGVAATCVIPPVGRDNVRYGSLDAAAMNNEGALLPSMTLIDTESWLHTTPSPGIDTPMTGTAASSRRISADTGLEQTGVSSTFNHSMFKPSTMVTDQDTAAAAALSNGLRISSDQESVHPLQVDPEPRPSFGDSGATAAPSSSSSTTLTLSFSSTSSPSSSSLTSPFTGESWLSSPPTSSKIPQSTPTPLTIQTQEAGGLPAHKSIREKSSLASKIRRVFNKPMGGNNNNSNNNNPSTKGQDVGINNQRSAQALEDIVSMTSREGDHGDTQGGGGFLGANELYSPGSAHLIEHRGSVSSSSSGESMSVGQDGFSPSTPSTSPEMSPSGSPKPKHALASLVTTGSTVAGVVPDGHPLSPVEIDNLAVLSPTTPTMGKPSEKRMSMELTSSRTTKKRLSFATITSFFHPSRNNSDSTTAFNNKKKQQRSSSVPNVEPVGLQVSGTPRRHSLNDLENSPQMQAKFSAPPWDKDRVSAKAAAVAAEVLVNSSNKSNKAHNENESSTPGTTTATMTTMSKIQGVFGKQSKKNKNKKNASLLSESTAPTATPESPTSKPLRSALVHRPLRTPSVRKAPAGRHVHQNEPLVIFSQGAAGVNNNSGSSRRSSEEQGRAGPTRHRRTSSIAGRQASQQGHYSAVDRKQCHSVLYSSSEEYDIVQHSDLYTNNQHQQQQQYQYHGGYIQYKGSVVPPAPTSRVNPVSTNDLPCNLLATTSPSTSRGAAAEGSFTFSPTGSRRRDSYPSCSSGSPSEDTSPKLASAAHNPNRRGSYDANSSTIAAAAAIGNPNRRSSYDANAGSMAAVIGNPNRRSSYDANSSVIAVAVSSPYRHSSYDANSPVGYNSRRSSIVVTSPSPLPAPVARLSVDHTLMSDHLSPSSPSARYPQAVSPNNAHHHALFANHQQQQQLQLQQQLHFQQQQQQFHQRSQQQRYQHHHHVQYDHHHQQQFMNPHAGPQVFQNQYHIQQQQPQKQQYQQYPSYPPYAYQYNMQQPLPSHLYYPSVQQHPGLISSSYAPVTTMPQYVPPKGIIVHNHASNGGPYPASCWSPSPSPHSPRPPRQLQFSTAQPLIHETWTPDQYDRTSDPNITAHRLTPAIAQRIKLELNTFKSQEMMVHQDSRINTHFFA